MNDKKQRKDRLDRLAEHRVVPFDLDFLRELGFEFGIDWDGQLIIEYPETISLEKTVNLVKKYENGIKTRLHFEGQKVKRVYVGGPFNGKPYYHGGFPNQLLCHHVKRGEWLVYMVKSHNDPRAWFLGKTSSKKNAKNGLISKQ